MTERRVSLSIPRSITLGVVELRVNTILGRTNGRLEELHITRNLDQLEAHLIYSVLEPVVPVGDQLALELN